MAKTSKQMSIKTRQVRAAVRQQLRDEGFIPPKKKPLNRTKFAKEVIEEWEAFEKSNEDCGILMVDIPTAFMAIISGSMNKATPEQIGALKVMKLAMEMYKYNKCAKADGKQCSFGELYRELIAPIREL